MTKINKTDANRINYLNFDKLFDTYSIENYSKKSKYDGREVRTII